MKRFSMDMSVARTGRSLGRRGRESAVKHRLRLRSRQGSAVAVDDATAVEVVRGELDADAVAREDPDPVAAHLAGGVAERLVAVVECDPEHPVPQRLDDLALQLDLLLLAGQWASSRPE